jgi:Astacin (Peptidase family M12A)
MSQNTPNDSSNVGPLDLPAEMFRPGEKTAVTVLRMQRKHYGLQNVEVTFSDLEGLAVFEGDIVLGKTADVTNETDPVPRGIGIIGEQYRWSLPIHFVTEESLRPRVEAAIAHWQMKTPFRFEEGEAADYLSFKRLTGCWSQVGRRGGEQEISLGTGCGIGAAIHEIGHAIGLWHEQSRSDRDNFIEIVWANVLTSQKHNFDKHVQDGQDLGNYDYDSIMHYPSTAFSVNGEPTIKTVAGAAIGQRNGLSKGDIAAVKMMYPNLAWPV